MAAAANKTELSAQLPTSRESLFSRSSRTSALTEPRGVRTVSYLSTRTPARVPALIDVRQNLRPVKKETDIYQAKTNAGRNVTFLAPISQRTSNFAHYFAPPPTFTSGRSVSQAASSVRSPTTMAISNAIGPSVLNRAIPKSERPWRQRLADNARFRNSYLDGLANSTEDSSTRLLAASRASRRPSIGSSSHPSSSMHSPAKDTPEQQLQNQLTALRNIVTEDKNKVRTADGALITPRGCSTIGSMPSTIRFRSSAMANSSYHPSLTTSINSNYSHVMSKSYSPIRSANSFLSSADSTASAALLHYEQSREKRQYPASRIASVECKAPLAAAESITDVIVEDQSDLKEGGQKTAERRKLSRSVRKQKSALAAAQSQSNSSSESEEKKLARPTKKTSKDSRKGVVESKDIKPSEKAYSAFLTLDPAAESNSAKMVAADNNLSTMLTRSPSKEGKKLEKKPVTPLAKRKKKEAETKKEQQAEVTSPSAVETSLQLADQEDESKYNAVAKFKPKISSSLPKPVGGSRAAARKKALSTVEAPVPGSWCASETERYISQNKHLTKKPCATKIEVVCKELQLEKLPVKAIRMLPVVKRKALLSKQLLNSSLTNKAGGQVQDVGIVLKPKPELNALKVIKSIAKPKKLTTALAIVNQEFGNKKRLRLGIQKTMFIWGFHTISHHLKCHQPKSAAAAIILTILFREQQKAASVTILSSAIPDINWAQLHKHLKEVAVAPPKKTREKVASVEAVASNKENLSGQMISKLPTVGPPLISSLRPLGKRVDGGKRPAFIKNSHIPCSNHYTAGGPIVLPDKSLLEEYVQRKRNELENLHNSDEFLSAKSSQRDSPNLIFSAEQLSNLVPSPSRTTVKAAEGGTNPTANTAPMVQISPCIDDVGNRAGKGKITTRKFCQDPLPDKDLANNNQPTAPNFMLRRHLKKPQEVAKPSNVFDTPKSLFEERMQNQAHQLKKTNQQQPTSFPLYVSEDHPASRDQSSVDLATTAGLRRRSSGEKPVAQNFSMAMDQLQKQHLTERYAAHIPLSGRQSTTSVDSSNSGALDTASRQLDQMIDQARYRHHQNARSKFKEAIDYLDHIFEDLRNECDKDGFPYKDNEKIETKPEVIAASIKSTGNRIQAAKATFQKQQSGSKENADRKPISKTNAKVNWQKNTSAVDVSDKKALSKESGKPSDIPSHQTLQRNNSLLKTNLALKTGQRKTFRSNSDVEVSETIVLPLKNTSDRLDFTRKWLVDDIKGWADHPNNKDLGLSGPTEQADFFENNGSDEHSLGSCSAEVAAINASEKKKKKVSVTPPEVVKPAKAQSMKQKAAPVKAIPQPKVVNTTEQVPLRPQPYRPQPQFAIYPPNGNVTESIYELQKVPSQEKLRLRYSQERAASQDYQSLGSTHSQEGLKPSNSAFLSTNSLHRGGAFVNYPQRGSIQSLPDAALLTVNQAPPTRLGRVAPNDHALTIDLLVAELELNTDAPSVSDKRRSFPTTQGELSVGSARRDSNQQANQSKLGVAKISVQRASNSPAKMPQLGQSSTLGRGSSLQQEKKSQQNSLDEVTEMLRDVAGDLHPKQTFQSRLQQQQQTAEVSPRKYSNSRAANNLVGGMAEKSAANPFETINQERLNPSRVEAIQHMFEKSGHSNGVSSWSKKLAKNSSKDTSYIDPVEQQQYGPDKPKLSTLKIAPIFRQQDTSPSVANSSEINGSVKLRLKPVDKTVPFSSAQPTLVLASLANNKSGSISNKPTTNSANSSQNSGYYSSSSLAGGVGPNSQNNTALAAPSSSLAKRSREDSVFCKKNSSSSRAPSIDVDDDGFYDNILADNRFSGVINEMDDASLCSQNLPPSQKSAGARIGQLIRRIGGSSLSKPPVQSAASLVSLNKISNDTLILPTRPHHGLMKSNSLSNEPWRVHAMNKEAASADNKSMGIGNRLKQTIFRGSKKRLQT